MIARIVLQRIDNCIEITRRRRNDKNKNNNDLSTDLHWDLTLQTLLVLVLVLIILPAAAAARNIEQLISMDGRITNKKIKTIDDKYGGRMDKLF
jgi:hypothetical protein